MCADDPGTIPEEFAVATAAGAVKGVRFGLPHSPGILAPAPKRSDVRVDLPAIG
jgi:hypothetical protein